MLLPVIHHYVQIPKGTNEITKLAQNCVPPASRDADSTYEQQICDSCVVNESVRCGKPCLLLNFVSLVVFGVFRGGGLCVRTKCFFWLKNTCIY